MNNKNNPKLAKRIIDSIYNALHSRVRLRLNIYAFRIKSFFYRLFGKRYRDHKNQYINYAIDKFDKAFDILEVQKTIQEFKAAKRVLF